MKKMVCPKCGAEIEQDSGKPGMLLKCDVVGDTIKVSFGPGKSCPKCGHDLSATESIAKTSGPADLVKRIKNAPKSFFEVEQKLPRKK